MYDDEYGNDFEDMFSVGQVKIQKMKKSMSETEIAEDEFVHMQTKCNAVENSLFNLQEENHSKLLELTGDYRLTLSGKLWGNDPDYKKTIKGLLHQVLATTTASVRYYCQCMHCCSSLLVHYYPLGTNYPLLRS